MSENQTNKSPGNCGTCKYWKSQPFYWDNFIIEFRRTAPMMGECCGMTGKGVEIKVEHGFSYIGGVGYKTIHTPKYFGCHAFEEKQAVG